MITYHTPRSQPQLSGLLPEQARETLIRASKVENERDRRVAIDRAIDDVKLRFPQYFQTQTTT